MKSYTELKKDTPYKVLWSDVVEFSKLDERRSCIDCVHANILGVNDGEVEWCPDSLPPSQAERLAWLWFIRPDLSEEIACEAHEPLRHLIKCYQGGTMDTWREEIQK
jgi:hypothetical protein